FGSTIVDRVLQPVFQFGGAKIGFNTLDRFMVALGNGLVVITDDGDLFGAQVDIENRVIGPVSQFVGGDSTAPTPRIGFNTRDRFMLADTPSLYVITGDGNVFAADADFATRKIGTVFQVNR